ncbi:MAG: U32 family peptidase [Lachnospiraceae bacterium]|nr:U32 family peptidase [Lachnospiraceae bacterium]
MSKPKVELLAPASGLGAVRAAVHAGADAVYTGGSRFGARAYAENMEEDELLQAVDYVHLWGKRLYLTVNTLLKEKELSEYLYSYLLPYYRQGLDAVIVQDIGVFCAIKELFPGLPIHISTQAVVTGKNSSRLYEELGADRIVTARELTLEELKEIRTYTDIEIESFIHGALCYCYSGQCLFSSFAGGRSGNRGRCAQPCRLPYELLDENGRKQNRNQESYLLSPKDICTLDILPDIIEAGVYSLKIEGRMKRAEYTAGVTEIYRKYLDQYLQQGREGYVVAAGDKERLMDLYNRGSFHAGYYQMASQSFERGGGKEMMSMDRPNHNGIYVGTLKKGKQGYGMKAAVSLHKSDVLELRTTAASKTSMKQDRQQSKEMEIQLERDVPINSRYDLPKKYYRMLEERGVSAVEVYRTKNDQLLGELYKRYLEDKVQIPVMGEVLAEEGRPIRLTLCLDRQKAEVTGSVIQKAKNQPINEEIIRKQIEKTGNSPFVFQQLKIQVIGNGFLPAKELNQLRREGLEALEAEIVNSYRRELAADSLEGSGKQLLAYLEQSVSGVGQPNGSEEQFTPRCHVLIEQLTHLDVVLTHESVKAVYMSIHATTLLETKKQAQGLDQLREAHKRCMEADTKLYLVFPHIWRMAVEKKILPLMEAILTEIDGIVAKNMEVLAFVTDFQKNFSRKLPVVLDYTAYAMNWRSVQAWKELGASSITVPLELNRGEIKAFTSKTILPMELVIYGHMPMMVSAQCPIRNTEGCRRQPVVRRLKDRKGNLHYVKNYCDICYSIIYNSDALYLIDLQEEIRNMSCSAVRLQFTIETKEEVERIMKEFTEYSNGQADSVGCPEGCTRGHWKRGVE